MSVWAMYAYDRGSSQRMNCERWLTDIGSLEYVRAHGLPFPIIPVRVEEVSPEDKCGTHWGWLDAEDDKPCMIYTHRAAVELCFPYGSAAETNRGRIVRLRTVEREEERP